MSDWTTAVLVALAIGAGVGYYVSNRSQQELAIKGGLNALIPHYITCMLLGSPMGFVVMAVALGLPFRQFFGTLVGFLVIAALSMMVYGYFEAQAPETDGVLKPELD